MILIFKVKGLHFMKQDHLSLTNLFFLRYLRFSEHYVIFMGINTQKVCLLFEGKQLQQVGLFSVQIERNQYRLFASMSSRGIGSTLWTTMP